ncbi:MAG: PIN domain-containing protein [Coleofasciculaceae cyanobacterium SM2_3_26]|nr:PIN domain-containing protein [Coleofasciculaceae cyanobacterium SM2_3_26]
MIRTFVDAGVLIAAARAGDESAERATAILDDPNRAFASSIFLKMEVLPKAIYNQQMKEAEFYESYFDGVGYWATDIEQLVQNAYQECCQFGLGSMDALHVAAAVSVGATAFVTNEKPGKSIYRTSSIQVLSIR